MHDVYGLDKNMKMAPYCYVSPTNQPLHSCLHTYNFRSIQILYRQIDIEKTNKKNRGNSDDDLKEQSRPCVSKLTSADVRDSGGVNSATSLVHVMNSF